MNYKKIYDSLIERAKNRMLDSYVIYKTGQAIAAPGNTIKIRKNK
jgi:hypothetical protein